MQLKSCTRYTHTHTHTHTHTRAAHKHIYSHYSNEIQSLWFFFACSSIPPRESDDYTWVFTRRVPSSPLLSRCVVKSCNFLVFFFWTFSARCVQLTRLFHASLLLSKRLLCRHFRFISPDALFSVRRTLIDSFSTPCFWSNADWFSSAIWKCIPDTKMRTDSLFKSFSFFSIIRSHHIHPIFSFFVFQTISSILWSDFQRWTHHLLSVVELCLHRLTISCQKQNYVPFKAHQTALD